MTTLDTLIHLGAGPCRELDAHLAEHPERLILVEADSRLAEALRARTQALEHVSVTQAAIASQPGPVTFHRYNLPDAGSLHRATALHELFPGLKLQQTDSLQAVGIGEFIDSLQLASTASHRLIIDLPGEEMACLQALGVGGRLFRFQWLEVHCGHQPLYDQAVAADRIRDWLEGEGFDLSERDAAQDPDRPRWIFKRNPLVQALNAARAEADKQAQQAAQYKAEAEKQTKATEQAKAEADKQAQQAAQYKAEADKQTKATEHAKAEADKQAQQAAQYKAEADKQTKATEQAKAEADRHAKLAAERAEQLEHSQQTQAALQRDNALALRLQQLRETDLKDLQQRYAQVVEQKAQQERLLKQLTERLTAASGYLHQLEQQADDPPPQLTETAGKSDQHHSANSAGKSAKHNKPSKSKKPNKKGRA